jgi:hypothetical protein
MSRVSTMVANAVAHPAVQLGVLTFLRLAGNWRQRNRACLDHVDRQLHITHMVLNQQRRRELALQIRLIN